MLAAVGATGVAAASAGPSAHCYEYERRADGSVDRLHRWSSQSWNRPSGSDPGWHLHGPHPLLERYLPRLLQGKGDADLAVLVPLCGKSCDMAFLGEEGFGVVGVEGISRAIYEFRVEQRRRIKGFGDRIILSQAPDGTWLEGARFEPADAYSGSRLGCVFKTGRQGLGYYADSPAVWRGLVHTSGRRGTDAKPLHVIQADMFDVTSALVSAATFVDGGVFDAVYDRAALVSLPPAAREEYVAVIANLVALGGRILLIAEDYDQAQVPSDPQGRRGVGPPPYALPEVEVRRLFQAKDGWRVEVLERVPSELADGGNPSFDSVVVDEVCYLVTKDSYGVRGTSPVALAACGTAAAVALLFGARCLLSSGGNEN